MAKIRFRDLDRFGLIKDTPATDLPLGAWSDGVNINFREGKVLSSEGEAVVFDPPSVAPYWILPVFTPDQFFWVYAGLTKVYAYNGTHNDITRSVGGDYTAIPSRPWTGGMMGGLAYLNNGVDKPQVWNSPAAATVLVDLPNWPANDRAMVLRPFGNFLVALDITRSGTRYSHMVKWSASATPGAVPSSWDETNPTLDAGETELDDTQAGILLDCLPLRDVNIIYKTHSTWGMSYIGGDLIFRFFKLFESQGLLTSRCVGTVRHGTHHFLANDHIDLVVHNGQAPASILDQRMYKWLRDNIEETALYNSFVTIDEEENEAWFCFPELGSTFCTKALVWDWNRNTVTIKELDNAAFIAAGVGGGAFTGSWDLASGDWNSDSDIWDLTVGQDQRILLQADPIATKLVELNTTNQNRGVNKESRIEINDLSAIGQNSDGSLQNDDQTMKLVQSVWPRMTGGPVNISVGVRDHIDEAVAIEWGTPVVFDPTTMDHVDLLDSGVRAGRYYSIRFETEADVEWALASYIVELLSLAGF